MKAARIDVIQYLRGVAALAVALAHIASMQRSFAPEAPPVVPEFSGFWGVDIFFVISGFIIVHITRELAPGGREATVFMLKRIVRIVPAYWFFTLLMFFADTQHWFSDQANRTNLALLWKSLLFVKPGFPLLFVGWTLTLEMFFYLIFAVGLWRWSAAARLGGVALVLSLLAAVPLLVEVTQRHVVFYTQAILLEFVAGMVLASAYGRAPMRLVGSGAVMVSVAGWGLLTLVTVLLPEQQLIQQRALWWGVPAVLIVWGALQLKAAPASKILYGLGAISYSLYLCHIPCSYLGAKLVQLGFQGAPAMSLWLYWMTTLTLTLAMATASWWLLERWPQAALRRVLGERR